jgi:hypothetical protein
MDSVNIDTSAPIAKNLYRYKVDGKYWATNSRLQV